MNTATVFLAGVAVGEAAILLMMAMCRRGRAAPEAVEGER